MHLNAGIVICDMRGTPLTEETGSQRSGDLVMSELNLVSAGAVSAAAPAPASSLVRFTPSDIARRHVATWNAIQTDAVEVLRCEPFEYGFRAPRHLLIMSERGERDDGETLVEGLPRSTLRKFSRKLSFVPAGHRYFGWQKPRALARVTYFYIDPRGPGMDPELNFAETEFKPRLFFFEGDLWETAQKLKAQAQSSTSDQRQYAEVLGVVLMHELLRLNNGTVAAEPSLRGGLAGWQRKRVAQYMQEHLSEGITLARLAGMAGLSQFHFVRSFKQSFGLPPHRYLSSLRMEKATSLLANPAASVTQIAFNLGFSETSSFTSAFRKHTGLTPTAYRRSL
jgi:AraC family transcriptional regulator